MLATELCFDVDEIPPDRIVRLKPLLQSKNGGGQLSLYNGFKLFSAGFRAIVHRDTGTRLPTAGSLLFVQLPYGCTNTSSANMPGRTRISAVSPSGTRKASEPVADAPLYSSSMPKPSSRSTMLS